MPNVPGVAMEVIRNFRLIVYLLHSKAMESSTKKLTKL